MRSCGIIYLMDGLTIQPLRRARLDAGLSQDDLAAMADVSQATISHIETGASYPSILSLARIARALGRGPYELVALPEGER